MTVNPPLIQPVDTNLDTTLRPQAFDGYIGQEQVKKNVAIAIQAAQKRSEPLEHILIHGPSGLGKTTLAHLIAHEMGSYIKVTSGAVLERPGDIGSILTNLKDGDILFIDEVHRLHHNIEEVLYPAMESFTLDIILGKGPSAKTLQIDLPRFTLIGATTRVSKLSAPFRSRFGSVYRLDFYTHSEISAIIRRAAKLLNVGINQDAADTLARSARFTPRIANRLLKRTRDLAQAHNTTAITSEIAQESLDLLNIDARGLEEVDRSILDTILHKYHNKPVGLKTLAASIGEEEYTIEEVHEPYLLRVGFLAKTPRGRIATPQARDHLRSVGYNV